MCHVLPLAFAWSFATERISQVKHETNALLSPTELVATVFALFRAGLAAGCCGEHGPKTMRTEIKSSHLFLLVHGGGIDTRSLI